MVASAASGPQASATKPDPFATREVYQDGWFAKLMIWYFSKVMSQQLGGERVVGTQLSSRASLTPPRRQPARPPALPQPRASVPASLGRPSHVPTSLLPCCADKPYDGTWDGFVTLSREIMRGRSTREQQEVVAGVLSGLLPPQAPERFRRWFPPNKMNSEFNALLTVLGFAWLVGPSSLKEVGGSLGPWCCGWLPAAWPRWRRWQGLPPTLPAGVCHGRGSRGARTPLGVRRWSGAWCWPVDP